MIFIGPTPQFLQMKIKNKPNVYKDFNSNLESIIQVKPFTALVHNVTGLKNELSTNWKRDQYFRKKIKFIQPQHVTIGNVGGQPRFYYYLPVISTLTRLLEDNSLRSYIISQPTFFKHKVHKSKIFKSDL